LVFQADWFWLGALPFAFPFFSLRMLTQVDSLYESLVKFGRVSGPTAVGVPSGLVILNPLNQLLISVPPDRGSEAFFSSSFLAY